MIPLPIDLFVIIISGFAMRKRFDRLKRGNEQDRGWRIRCRKKRLSTGFVQSGESLSPRGLAVAQNYLIERKREGRTRLLPEIYRNRMRANRYNIEFRKFLFDIRRIYFTVAVVKNGKLLLEDVVEHSSLKITKTQQVLIALTGPLLSRRLE